VIVRGPLMQSDEELMLAYVRGEASAFHELFRRYAPALLRLMRRELSSQSEAQDLVQQTFLQIHRARNDFDLGRRLKPWVYTIALNLKREYLRGRKRRPTQPLDQSPEPGVDAVDPEREDRARALRRVLSGLPAQQREVIELHWFDELSFQEVGQALGISTTAAKVRAHRGYVRLKEALTGLGLGNLAPDSGIEP
jgi:RNA polymerase sigma factor (sigma-70 family)